MTTKPPYQAIAEQAAASTGAHCVVLLVINGQHGSAFSMVAAAGVEPAAVTAILRSTADDIDRQAAARTVTTPSSEVH